MSSCDETSYIDETGMRHVEDRPFLYALSLIEGKWKLHILFHLWKNPVLRYSQLKRALGGVTHKMLSSRLKELEADGLITRHEYPRVPPKVEYALSARGRTLMPVLHDLCEWGHKHMDDDVTIANEASG